jgi:hypothetical protein
MSSAASTSASDYAVPTFDSFASENVIIESTADPTTNSTTSKKKKNKKTATSSSAAATMNTNTNNYDDECQVCCSKHNKSTNKPVVCPSPSCSYSACVSCIRTYLINNPLSTPHCMACKKQFNNMFLVENLTKTWTIEKYNPHISNVMVDIEISKLSESMQEAERRRKKHQIISEMNDLRIEKDKKIREILEFYDSKNTILQNQLYDVSNKKEERKAFMMPCSFNNCNGMLSTQYKCGICEKFTCKDCHEPRLEEHKCNPDSIASAQMIQKDTRPCPSCRTRIYKIEGCDQMWCTNCKTPFSWTTGKVVPSGQRIHNPHAIEFLKQNGINIRAPGDLPCGGIITRQQYLKIEKNIKNIMHLLSSMTTTNESMNDLFVKYLAPSVNMVIPNPIPNLKSSECIFEVILWNLYTAYTIVNEVSNNKLREAREITQAQQDYNEERVEYILNQITRDDFADKINRNNKQKRKNLELSFIWEILSTFGIEMFTVLYNSSVCNNIEQAANLFTIIFQKLQEFSSLIHYVNSQLAAISVTHSCCVPIINYSFDSHKPTIIIIEPCQTQQNWVVRRDVAYEHIKLFGSEMFSMARMNREYSS